jgi:hypothetical protein
MHVKSENKNIHMTHTLHTNAIYQLKNMHIYFEK